MEEKDKQGHYKKGTKFSDQHKRRISEARKKYFEEHPEAREKQKHHLMRRLASGEIKSFSKGNQLRKGKDPWNKGKTAKEDPRILKHANIIDPKTGRARNYKGGKKYFTNNERLKLSAELRQWRISVFQRDNYTCQKCGARNGNGKKIILNADHIKSFVNYPDLRLDIENGRTLCLDCHRKTANFGGRVSWSKELL